MAQLSAVERARLKARIQGLGNYNPPALDEDDAAERALAQAGNIVSDSLEGLSENIQNDGVVEATIEAVGNVGEAWGRGLGAAMAWLQGEDRPDCEKTGQATMALGIGPQGAAYGVTKTSAGGGINAVWVMPEDASEPKEPTGKFSEAQLKVNRIAECSIEATPAITDAILKECTKAGFSGPQLGEMICMAVNAEGKESSSMNMLTLLSHLQAKGGDFVRDALVEVKKNASTELLKLKSSKQYADRAESLLKSTGIIEPPKLVDLLDFDDSPRRSLSATTPHDDLADLFGCFDSAPKAAEPASAAAAPIVPSSTAPAVPTTPADFMGLLDIPAPTPAPATPGPSSGNDLFDLAFSTVPTPAKPAQRKVDTLASAFAAPAALEPTKLHFDAIDKVGCPPPLRNQRDQFADLLNFA